MPYTRPYTGGFKDYPDTTTPINATALNTMDVGIKTANDQFQTVTTAQRTALSPTVGQAVWDSDLKQLMVYMNASGGNAWQPVGNRIVCASTTRPSTPFHGQMIYETDTKREYVYNGSAWVQTNSASTTSGVTGVSNLIVPPMCKLNYSTSQTIANNTDTVVTFNTSEFDTDGMGTTGSGAKITINTAGVYLISYSVNFSGAAAATGNRWVCVIKNGTGSAKTGGANTYGWQVTGYTIPNNNVPVLVESLLLSLAATDYIQLQVAHTQGANLNISDFGAGQNYLSATWVGRTS